jgi:beta-lactamase regulating signal transducer with metallopeptidase domain/protocatechuate 3,4-dioxygenase beta subunit
MTWFIEFLRIPSATGFWQAFAADVTLKAGLALAGAFLASVALRRASASLRHLVWTAALAGTLAMPFLTLALPAWRLPILPEADSGSPLYASVEPPTVLPASIASPMPAPTPAIGPPSGARMTPIERSEPAGIPESRFARTPGPAVRSSARTAVVSWTPWIAAAWGTGAIVVLLPWLIGLSRLCWLARRSTPASGGRLADLAERLRLQLGRGKHVVVLRGNATISPLTWGVLRPVILLPATAESWPQERLRAVLLHELAHVSRWDCLTQALARLACALYWFDPLAWLAAHRLRIESERACDDLVLRSGSRAIDYAACLLDVARSLRSLPGLSVAAVPIARPSQLEGRIVAILDRSRSRRAVTRRGACLFGAAVAALLLPLSAARLVSRAASAMAQAKLGGTGGERSAGSARSARMTVTGRVLDPDGRPVPAANVAIVGRRKLSTLTARSEDHYELMARAEADADGRFRLEVPRTSSITHYDVRALAARPGLGLGWAELNRDAESPSADVRLKVEQVVQGRLVDLQGTAAPGVAITVSGLGIPKPEVGGYDGINFWHSTPNGLENLWPGPCVTDAEGRFQLAGIGRAVVASLAINDPRFARQSLRIETSAKESSLRATIALQPAMRVWGRVTHADTGAPMPGAIVSVGSGSNMFSASQSHYRTDANGRYEANPAQGKYIKVTVYPPAGSPYLIHERNFEDNDDAARREVNLTVPRGVLLTGRVTERGSGQPLAGAGVFYENGRGNVVDREGTIPGWMAAVDSDVDGRYAIAVTPGKGQLLFYGPTADFVHEVKGSREIPGGKPGGTREYAHAFVPYDVKPGQGPVANDVVLTPGVTLVGRVVGPDGQPVERAEIITTLSISPSHTSWRGDFTIPVRAGRFELHGLARDRPVRCSFLDSKNGWGTTLELTGAMAARGPLTVKLQPGGTAKARIVDEQGHPVAKRGLDFNVVATPGPGHDYDGETLTEAEQAMLRADEEIYANVDRPNYWEHPKADREGRIIFPKLIPGATYRIYEFTKGQGARAYRWRDFTVEAGQTIDLGDVRVKTEAG